MKGLSKGSYDETFAGEDVGHHANTYSLLTLTLNCRLDYNIK